MNNKSKLLVVGTLFTLSLGGLMMLANHQTYSTVVEGSSKREVEITSGDVDMVRSEFLEDDGYLTGQVFLEKELPSGFIFDEYIEIEVYEGATDYSCGSGSIFQCTYDNQLIYKMNFIAENVDGYDSIKLIGTLNGEYYSNKVEPTADLGLYMFDVNQSEYNYGTNTLIINSIKLTYYC